LSHFYGHAGRAATWLKVMLEFRDMVASIIFIQGQPEADQDVSHFVVGEALRDDMEHIPHAVVTEICLRRECHC